MTFGKPLWLLALLVLPLLAAFYWRAQILAKPHLQRIVAPRLRERLAGSVHHARRTLRFLLLLLAAAFGIVALAQPQLGTIEQHVERKGRDVFFAIDTSKSMLANDTAPDRLTRAKLAAEDLLNDLQGDRAGVIAFAGTSFVQAPMTIDYGAVRDSIEALDTNVIPQGGTDIAGAIRQAADAFGSDERGNRALVIFSDGEDLQDDALKAAQSVAGKIRIFTVGVGTTDGALIPLPNDSGGTDFVRDSSGNFVKSHLDPSRLQQIAAATGGFYLHLGDSFSDMKQLFSQGIVKLSEQKIDARMSSRPIERYQWPLGIALARLCIAHLISDRRKTSQLAAPKVPAKAKPVIAALIVAAASTLHAESGLQLYHAGKFPEAYAAFQDALQKRPDSPELQFDAGASAYQAGKYNDAVDAFGKVLGSSDQALHSRAQYNLGSALFQRGSQQKAEEDKVRDWENSAQHFSDVLKSEPQNADAKYNLDVVNKALEELKRKKDEQKQQDQNQQQNQKNDQKDSQKNQSQNSQNQSQSNQSKQQSQNGQSQPQNAQNQNLQSQQNQQQQNPKNSSQSAQNGEQQQQNSGDKNAQNNGQKSEPQKNDQASQQQQSASAGASPSATPREGKIETAGEPQGSPSPGDQNGQAQAAAAEEAGKPGEMTPQQARLLLESLKGDESKVQLNEPAASGRVEKDW